MVIVHGGAVVVCLFEDVIVAVEWWCVYVIRVVVLWWCMRFGSTCGGVAAYECGWGSNYIRVAAVDMGSISDWAMVCVVVAR